MPKVVTIVEDNPITGVKYGTVDIPETPTKIEHTPVHAQKMFQKAKSAHTNKIRSERTKHK